MKNSIIKKVVLVSLLAALPSFATNINNDSEVYISSPNPSYKAGDSIDIKYFGLQGNEDDWVGIYPTGASNDWENVLSWSWTNGDKDGEITLEGLEEGNYEARVFFHNSFKLVSKTPITVTGANNNNNENNNNNGALNTKVSTSKSSYNSGESIAVTVKDMKGADEDWIGIYPAGASNDWDNVLSWEWTNGAKNATISLEGVTSGSYEVRAFFENSFKKEATASFSVKAENNNPPVENNPVVNPPVDNNPVEVNPPVDNNPPVVNGDLDLLETAENGLSQYWFTIIGNASAKVQKGGFESAHSVKLTTNWINNFKNEAEYWLMVEPKKYKYLDIDIGGVGSAGGHVLGIHKNSPAGHMPHYFVGVKVDTKFGERNMIWDSWYNHEGLPATLNNYGDGNVELVFPSPTELVRGYGFTPVNNWAHFHVDLESSLKSLEPGNSIKSITYFIASGGFLDNITVSN